MWKFFLNNKGEVENTGEAEAGSFQDVIEKGLEEAETTTEKKAEETAETKPEIEAGDYKGADRRAKAYDGERRRESDKALEDPEYEMDFELEQGKGKHKFKLSDLKDTAKWLHENKGSLQASLELRKLATQNPTFAKLVNSIIEKSVAGEGKFNDEFINKQLASLEAKQEKVEGQIDDKDDQIKEIEDLLKSDDIDPDSVQAKVLQRNLAALKSSRAQLKDALSKISQFEQKVGELEKGQKDFLTKHENAESAVEVKRVSEIFRKTFTEITDPSKENGYKFIDDEEKADYEAKVRDLVAKSTDNVKDDDSFVKLIQSSCKAVYDRMSKLRESYVNDYLRSKGGKPGGEETPDAAKELDTMKQQLSELEKAGKGETSEAVALRDKINKAQELIEDPLGGKSIGEVLAENWTK